MDILVGTQTSSGRIKNTTDKVFSIEFHARSKNKESVSFGRSDVADDVGREMTAGEYVVLNFGVGDPAGSVPFNVFYAHISGGGSKLDWVAIVERN